MTLPDFLLLLDKNLSGNTEATERFDWRDVEFNICDCCSRIGCGKEKECGALVHCGILFPLDSFDHHFISSKRKQKSRLYWKRQRRRGYALAQKSCA